MSKYEKISKLGEGGFGKVYLIKDKETEKTFAMKTLNLNNFMQSADSIMEINRESKVL